MKKLRILSLRNLSIVAVLFASVFLFASCKKDSNNNSSNNNYGGIMAFNLAPDKNAVGFSISGNNFTPSPLMYTSYTGGYQPVYPGNRTVEAFDFNNGAGIASMAGNFEARKYYSAFLLGVNGNYRNVISEDQLDSLDASNGKAYLRYINAIADSSNPTVKITGAHETPWNEQAAFGQVSEFKAATPGNVDIAVTNGSTINASRSITTEANKVYTILLVGAPGGQGTDSVQVKFIQNGTITP